MLGAICEFAQPNLWIAHHLTFDAGGAESESSSRESKPGVN